MKKIALTLAAVAAFGVAGCQKTDSTDANNTADVNATATEAGTDVNGAVADANASASNATTATDNALDATGNAISNTASDVGNAAAAGAGAVSNAAHDATH
ncbi:MAG: circumsporozoite protein [Allosphingosinicella sp.]|jgi:hypothetical protein